MPPLPPAALARAHAQERLESARRAINRTMIEAARERAQYVARHGPACMTPTPEMEAHHRLRALLAAHTAPQLSSLRRQALAWLAEDQELTQEQQTIDRLMRASPRPGAARAPRVPRGYVAGCPWPVTLAQGRLLDLRCLGASTREIAAVETISRYSVQTVLKRLSATLGAPDQPAARAVWRAWCAATGRGLLSDPRLVAAWELVRSRPRSPVACRLSPDEEVADVG